MAKYSGVWSGITATATSAGANNLVDSTYPFALQGGGSTQRNVISEVYIGGEDTAATPTRFVLARDDVQVASGTKGGITAALLDGSATAPGTAPLCFNTAATNKPQRGTTPAYLLGVTFNTFGGVIRWVAAPGNEIAVVGNTAGLGEVSLSSFSGAGKTSGHVIFETV